MTVPDNPLLEKVERLRFLLTGRATGGVWDQGDYQSIRSDLMAHPDTRGLVPKCVKVCRNEGDFWAFIREQSPHYQERRAYLREAFEPLLSKLEGIGCAPAEQPVTEVLSRVDVEHVNLAWRKALDRRAADPEGAITAARALLESVCKHILDESGVDYGESPDVTELYRLTAEKLNLAPSQHTEQVFKKILGSCQAVVDGLASMRNRLGDAHGKGSKAAKPAPRHAELAVNLAGTMASFLIATWESRKQKGP